jgi:WD40 repeat protein
MTTDMTSIKFWEFESHKNIGYITKEKFDSFSINFYQCKLLTSDNICIDITDIMSNMSQQKYIWLDENPTQFTSFTFSPDYKVLLAIIDDNSAITYNCSNGSVIKKWKINLPNWSRACQMVPETSSIGVIATKSYNKIIKIWDYLTGTDLTTFQDFDVNNFSFSKYGNFLAAGTTEGEEIVRVWNLKTLDDYKLYYKQEEGETKNININTYVKIYSENKTDIKGSTREDSIDSFCCASFLSCRSTGGEAEQRRP